MMSFRWGILCPVKSKEFLKSRQRATETFGKNLGVVGFEPRTPFLEHTCLPTRVQSSALMRTATTEQVDNPPLKYVSVISHACIAFVLVAS